MKYEVQYIITLEKRDDFDVLNVFYISFDCLSIVLQFQFKLDYTLFQEFFSFKQSFSFQYIFEHYYFTDK